jgi:hypothetical protein
MVVGFIITYGAYGQIGLQVIQGNEISQFEIKKIHDCFSVLREIRCSSFFNSILIKDNN